MSILARLALTRPNFNLDVSLDLPGRGISALFGPSGSGKTSILRCLAGLDRNVGGRVEVAGDIWQDDTRFVPPHQRQIGYVFQEASLLPHLSVQRNLEYGWRRTPPALRRISLARAGELLGLGHLLARMPYNLSGGERQRAAIARALLTSPRLLLMDEPLSGLDQASKQEILVYLKRLHAELDIPLLYVSHALDEVVQLADNMVLLEAGKVRASGPVGHLLTRLDLPFAHEDEAQSLIEARVTSFDPQFHLHYLACPFGPLSIVQAAGQVALQAGQWVRVRIGARDVSIALHARHDSSILNSFPAYISAIDPDRPGQVLLSLNANQTGLLARITAKSASALRLAVGQQIIAQVKGVALVL
jgi:molybdate transport system ATP-binding protein